MPPTPLPKVNNPAVEIIFRTYRGERSGAPLFSGRRKLPPLTERFIVKYIGVEGPVVSVDVVVESENCANGEFGGGGGSVIVVQLTSAPSPLWLVPFKKIETQRDAVNGVMGNTGELPLSPLWLVLTLSARCNTLSIGAMEDKVSRVVRASNAEVVSANVSEEK